MKADLMIWTRDGAWLQTHGSDGAVHLSGVGALSLTSVQRFCQEHAIDLLIKGDDKRRERFESYSWVSSLSAPAREEFVARGR